MKLFHQTQEENVASIMQHGLQPSKMGIVYLSPLEDVGFGPITLEVETGGIKLTAFDDCKEWEVLCWGSIKPENIKRYDRVKV